MRAVCLLSILALSAAAPAAADPDARAPYASPVVDQITRAMEMTQARGHVLAGARVTLFLDIDPDGDLVEGRIVELGDLPSEADIDMLETILTEALDRLERHGFDGLPEEDHDLWGAMEVTFRLGVRPPPASI